MEINTIKANIVKTIELRIKLDNEEEIAQFQHILVLMDSYLCGHGTERQTNYVGLTKRFITGLKNQLNP